MDYSFDDAQFGEEFPPLGFDSRKSSDELLSRHNLPPGSGKDRPLTWARKQGYCVDEKVVAGRYYYSLNWVGDEVRSTSAYKFTGVHSYYRQAAITSTCGTMSELTSWVGLGGSTGSTGDLVQAGTHAWGPGWHGGLTEYEAFWEVVTPSGHGVIGDMGIAVYPGDAILASVSVSSGTAYFTVIETTQGFIGTGSYYIGGLYDGTSAEFIDERMYDAVNDKFLVLNNFGSTYWYSMAVHRSNSSAWTGVYLEPNEVWNYMYSGPKYGFGPVPPPPASYQYGHRLAKTSGTYSDNHMHNTWVACS